MYFLKPRRRERVVPSTLLWRPAAVNLSASRPWQRLEKQWLLWLQLAAAALLALGAAGPVAYLGRPSPSLIVLLDASASMQATDVAPSRFDRAKDEVLSLARGLDRGATLTLITFARQPQVVVQQAGDPGEVEPVLREIAPTPFGGNIVPALSLARSLAEGQGETRLVLVGDGGYAAEIPADVEFIPVGGQGGNVALAGMTLRPMGNGNAVQVAVVNHGGAPAAGRVGLEAGGELLAPQAWRLDPGETTYLLWPQVLAAPSYTARLSVDTGANTLFLDDVVWAVPEETREAKVLLVSPGNLFLERALELAPSLAVYRVSPAQYTSLLSGSYGYELTVIDGLVGPVPPGAVMLVNPPAGEVMPGLKVGEVFRPASLQAEATPLMQHVDLARVQVAVARELQVDSTWTADITAGGSVLAAHGLAGGRPVVVLGFDLALSDLPLRPAFPVLVHNLVSWLQPPDLGLPAAVAPGEEVAVAPLPQAEAVAVRQEAPQREPAGAGQVLAPPFPPAPWVAGNPGLYRVEQDLEGPAGGPETRVSRLVAVNGYDPQEADLAVRRPGETGERQATGAAPPRPRPRSWPLAAPLAAAVLALSLVEWGVASRGR